MINLSKTLYKIIRGLIDRYLGNYPNFLQFINFCIVGFSVAIVDFGLLVILKEFIGLEKYFSNTIALLIAVIAKFLLHRYWVFKAQADTNVASERKKFVKFITVTITGIGINNGVIFFLLNLFNLPGPGWFYFSKIVATAVVLFWNYFANKFWTFKKQGYEEKRL